MVEKWDPVLGPWALWDPWGPLATIPFLILMLKKPVFECSKIKTPYE